ncbi:MAG TPA: GerMN domain-containing protein [Coleofasciculaceae cyanobacterium]|jgi:hypothetical protein
MMKLSAPTFIVCAGLLLFLPLAWQKETSAVEYATPLPPTNTSPNWVASENAGMTKAEQPSSLTNTVRLNTVKVFFPKQPRSNNDLSYVESVSRTTGSQSLARFAVEQLIAGPTRDERQKGFAGAIQLRGSSNCASDFKLSISQGVARTQFCRTIVSAGVGDDARIKSSLTATLKQFKSVQSVIILDEKGNCFGDMSGENRCLN